MTVLATGMPPGANPVSAHWELHSNGEMGAQDQISDMYWAATCVMVSNHL